MVDDLLIEHVSVILNFLREPRRGWLLVVRSIDCRSRKTGQTENLNSFRGYWMLMLVSHRRRLFMKLTIGLRQCRLTTVRKAMDNPSKKYCSQQSALLFGILSQGEELGEKHNTLQAQNLPVESRVRGWIT